MSNHWYLALTGIPATSANAQTFRLQCPTSTITHPLAANKNIESADNGPTASAVNPNAQFVKPSPNVNGALKSPNLVHSVYTGTLLPGVPAAADAATAARSALPRPNLPTGGLKGHAGPRQIMAVAVMNGNIPA